MIPVAIFTYEADGPMAVLAGMSAQQAGFGTVYIFEQHDKPLTSYVRQRCHACGFKVVTTNFNRQRNLNGIQAVAGEMQVMQRALEAEGASHILKLDSDTIMVRSTLMREFAEQDVVLAGMRAAAGKGQVLLGACYMVSKDLVDEILSFIKRWQGIPGVSAEDCPEDKAVGTFARVWCENKCQIMKFNPEGGMGKGWVHGDGPEKFPEFAERYEYVNFGNHKDSSGNPISSASQYMVMLEFAKHLNIV